MKRILAPFMLILIILQGCTMKNYTPEIPTSFTQMATVTSGDFSFNCEICKNENIVTVSVLDTKAKGLKMVYDGVTLSFVYDNMNCDLPAANFERTNIAIIIYEVFRCLGDIDAQSVSRTEGGFRMNGTTSLGDFVLIMSDASQLVSLYFKTNDISIIFT